MKREGFIFDRIVCPANIDRAITNSSRHKRGKRVVRNVLDNRRKAVQDVKQRLEQGFTPSPYTKGHVFDGANKKERIIEKPKYYPDQIVHWALVQQIEPLIMRGMYEWSCGSIPGRGQARCKQAVERWLRDDPKNTRYCLKLDIHKFYQSIDNEVMKRQFRRIIKDKKALSLIDSIVDSTQGLNIGNFTSQWFANFYLQPCDHFIKEKLRHFERRTKRGEVKKADAVVYYARYADDMVLFGRNKDHLHKARQMLFDFLRDELHLEIKDNWQLFLVTTTITDRKTGETRQAGRDVDFLGYKMNHERTILRRRLSLRIARRARKISKKPAPTHADCAAMVSYNGFLLHSDSHNFIRKRIMPFVNLTTMKGRISNDNRAKQRNACAPSCRARERLSVAACAG